MWGSQVAAGGPLKCLDENLSAITLLQVMTGRVLVDGACGAGSWKGPVTSSQWICSVPAQAPLMLAGAAYIKVGSAGKLALDT